MSFFKKFFSPKKAGYTLLSQEEPSIPPRRNEPIVRYICPPEAAIEALQSLCKKEGKTYTDLLAEDFLTWVSTADKCYTTDYNSRTKKLLPRSLNRVVKLWATQVSDDLKKQHRQQLCYGGIVRYCEQNGLEYDPVMNKQFDEWMADPANKHIITVTTETHTYARQPAWCVKKWFATLNKQETLKTAEK